MLTNILNLPQPLVEAVRNDPYDKGDCKFSATELIAPPHMRTLMRNHADDINVDASDRIWSLLGQSVHAILERATTLPEGWIVERRYIGRFEPQAGLQVTVGAKIDVLNTMEGILDDYKVTSVYKFKKFNGRYQIPPEYEAQINIQAECIFQETGVEVKKGRIIGILKDWKRSEQRRDPGSYPDRNVAAMEIPIWPRERRVKYISDRILLHMLPEPPVCSKEDRWEKDEKWAVMKHGQKKAVRLCDSETAATAMMSSLDGVRYYVQHRPGGRTRCESYCEVAEFCKDYQASLVATEARAVPSENAMLVPEGEIVQPGGAGEYMLDRLRGFERTSRVQWSDFRGGYMQATREPASYVDRIQDALNTPGRVFDVRVLDELAQRMVDGMATPIVRREPIELSEDQAQTPPSGTDGEYSPPF